MVGAVSRSRQFKVRREMSGEKECCACSEKRKDRSPEEYRDLINRLSRIEGQVRGIKAMVERGAYCTDILIQTSACTENNTSHVRRGGRDKRVPSRLVATSATAHILNWDSVRNYPERDKRGENRADLKLIFPNGITGREIQVCGRGSRENLRPQACPGSLSRKLPNGIRIYGKVGRV